MKAFTPEQLAGLRAIVKLPRWKTRVRKIWDHPERYTGDYATALYSLRNTHGPAWLRGARSVDFAAPGAA